MGGGHTGIGVPSHACLPTASCRACEMDPALFEVPRGYSVVGTHQDALREDEDDLLQFAIQQSLLEAGSEYDQVGTMGRAPPQPPQPTCFSSNSLSRLIFLGLLQHRPYPSHPASSVSSPSSNILLIQYPRPPHSHPPHPTSFSPL